jgi:leucyl aminopeptidase (aminopeptidase T)
MKTTAEQPPGAGATNSVANVDAAPAEAANPATLLSSGPSPAGPLPATALAGEFDLLQVPFLHEYSAGARNAVTACLRVQQQEKVTLITDEATLQIAAALAVELDRIGCQWNAFVLETEAEEEFATAEARSRSLPVAKATLQMKTARPLAAMPRVILDDMETSQVSIFAVQTQAHELHSRMQMTDVVNRRRMRHANMAGITGEIMMQGMCADFDEVDRISQAVLDKVRAATYLRATTAAGTDIHAQFGPEYRWLKTSGIIGKSKERWCNLPGGECYTTPAEVNGVFVVDGVAGDVLGARYGLLRGHPLTIAIEGNRIARATSKNKALERDFWEITRADANSDRVGELAIGTNVGVERLIGNILQDEKFPGVHLAFGDPYGAHTGAAWKSSTHVDVVGLGFSVWLGDAHGEEQIMRDGEFTLDI